MKTGATREERLDDQTLEFGTMNQRFAGLPYRYGGEAVFAPRTNAELEDDGYLVTFVTDMIEDRSECILYDASDLSVDPVCRIILPHRICSGTHATWAHGSDIRAAGRKTS